jgi:hypothetical protein
MSVLKASNGKCYGKGDGGNDWNTTPYIWDKIIPYMPKNKMIWCPFYNDGYCKNYLEEKGFNVIHNDEDFWEVKPHYENVVVVDNPPYKTDKIKLKESIMLRFIENNTPFMLLLPSTTIQTKYFKEMSDKYGKFQLIIPKEKYNFEKVMGEKTKCLFYTLWICWNMDLAKDVIFL